MRKLNMKLYTTSVKLNKQAIEHIKRKKINLSAWLRENYKLIE